MTVATPQTDGWAEAFANLRGQWARFGPAASTRFDPEWPVRLDELASRMRQLQREGEWVRGPRDLLTICGLHRWERAHTAALAWLCDPQAPHGLGSAVLERVLARTGPIPDLDTYVTSRTEVSRPRSRADVVVTGLDWTLVVEAKIDAVEGHLQCEDLYIDWTARGEDVRFLFLTLRGQAPISTCTPEAEQSWRNLTWTELLADLRAAVASRPPGSPTSPAVAEYERTLAQICQGRS